jgi:hypothetical protein
VFLFDGEDQILLEYNTFGICSIGVCLFILDLDLCTANSTAFDWAEALCILLVAGKGNTCSFGSSSLH